MGFGLRGVAFLDDVGVFVLEGSQLVVIQQILRLTRITVNNHPNKQIQSNNRRQYRKDHKVQDKNRMIIHFRHQILFGRVDCCPHNLHPPLCCGGGKKRLHGR